MYVRESFMVITGKFFRDTYCHKIGSRYYLAITTNTENPVQYIQNVQKPNVSFQDIDGVGFWCLPIKQKWMNSLNRYNERRLPGLYTAIKQFLTEEGIKTFYYDIWLNNHNYHQRKRNTFEKQQKNYLRNRGLLEDHDGHIKYITRGLSINEAAKMSIY